MPSAPVPHHTPKTPARAARMPGAPGETPYYQAVSAKFRVAKYLTFLTLVVFLIFSFTFLRSDITLENLRYLLKCISFTNTETSITATKINYASGDPNRLELFIGDLCTLSPEGYAIYDSRGNQIMAEDISYASPVLKVGARFALCYDMSGTSFTVLNTFAKLYEGTTEYPITDGCIGDDGSFAIASSSREYRTAITLYDADFEPITRIYKNDHLMGLEMKSDGSEVAVMTAGVLDGAFYTRIELVAPHSEKASHIIELDGLGYTLYYTEGGFVVVTDEGLCFLDEELELRKFVAHDTQLAMTHCSGKHITCVTTAGVIGNSYTVHIYDVSGRLIYEGGIDGKLIAIDSDDTGYYTFILHGTTVTRVNLLNKKIGTLTVEPDAIDLLAQSSDSILVALKNYALTYELADFKEHYYDRSSGTADEAAETTSEGATT